MVRFCYDENDTAAVSDRVNVGLSYFQIPLAQRLYTAAEDNDLETVQTCLKIAAPSDSLWVNSRVRVSSSKDNIT